MPPMCLWVCMFLNRVLDLLELELQAGNCESPSMSAGN